MMKIINGVLMAVLLEKDDREFLERPVNGSGGQQGLQRYMKSNMHGDVVLFFEEKWVERYFRYRDEYGPGGWQQRLGRGRASE